MSVYLLACGGQYYARGFYAVAYTYGGHLYMYLVVQTAVQYGAQ